MIPPAARFWSPTGNLLNGGPWTWHIIDWDQRHWISVKGSEKAMPEADDAIEILRRHIDLLGPDVHRITVSDEGDIISVSTKPKHEASLFIHYPRYDPYDMPDTNYTHLRRLQLEEVDRLAPSVDLVRYEDSPGKFQLAVFKYAILFQQLPRIWNELHILAALPRHELIVPFGRVVLDDVEPRILGFTLPFIAGGTFDNNKTRPFRFAWLQQLTSVVDDLNLKFGIVHQDIFGFNLAVDPVTEKIQLFDFGIAAKIGTTEVIPYRNDVDAVVFTVYEILTLDGHFRSNPHDDPDVNDVEKMVEWDVKIPIEAGDGGINKIRNFLAEWAEGRRSKANNGPVTAPSQLDWPDYPPQTPIPFMSYPDSESESNLNYVIKPGGGRYAKDARYSGQNVVQWKRPPMQPFLTNNEN